MIKRDKRNIGKRVEVDCPGTMWHQRKGTVAGFRGNYQNRPDRIPYVTVLMDDANGCWPFPGHRLNPLTRKQVKQEDK